MDFTSIFPTPVLASSPADYFIQSNFAGQVIVVILLAMSIYAWGIMICKKADLSAIEEMNAKTARLLKSSSLVEAASSKSIQGPFAKLLKNAVNAWLEVGISPNDRAARISYVENTLGRTLARQQMQYNSKMTQLGTIVSGGPFLGLLGTAWGVMDCFGSMSSQASVTLQMLAPGVAGSLLTTVAGLVVAIPSVFGYNMLADKARKISVDTENFASLIADRIEMESREHSEEVEPVRQPAKPAPVREIPQAKASAPVRTAPETKIMDFSLDDEDDGSPTPPRQFDE